MGSSDTVAKMKQSSIASWINPFQRPRYKTNGPSMLPAGFSSSSNSPSSRPPSAPPAPTLDRHSTSTSGPLATPAPELSRNASLSSHNPPKSTSPTPSLKRKRESITNGQPTNAPPRRHIIPVSGAIDRLSGEQETPASSRSSGLSLASHTPPTPSSLPSPAIGGAQEKPIAIRSSPAVVSSQNKSFVVQSSQSDERVESEEEIEEGDDTVLADDPQRSKRVQQQLDGTKPTIQDLDGDSDSDSSLEDLDAMLNRNRKKQERPPTPPATTSARSKRTGAFKGSYDVPQTFENILSKANETSAAKATPTPQYRYSLAKLVKQHKKGEQRRTAMEEAEAASKAREQHALAVNVDAGELDKDVLASVVKEEDGESSFSKVLQALERADVMTKQVEYHFFDWHLETPELKSPGRLRLEKAPPEVVALFEDGPARDECFLNGFAAELALTDVFGEQNRPWLLQRLWEAAIGEPREDLSQAYLEAGKILSTHADFAGWIQPHHVEETFRRCSASASAIDRKQNERLLPNHGRSGKAPYHRHARLLRTLHVLEHTAQSLSPNSVSYTLGVLLRLAADTQIVKKDVEVQMALQRAFAALFEQILSDENGTRRIHDISTSTLQCVSNPILQQHILSNIPCTTQRLALFRRRLALSFFLLSPDSLSADLHSKDSSTTLSRSILTRFRTHPNLQITPETDYPTLSALITLLDTGIGPGFSTHPELLHPNNKTPAATAAKVSHNESIDALIAPVTALIARINDCGASHMARTDAKGVLERLVQRLNFCVRTVPRRRGGRGAWLMEGEQGKLDGFFGGVGAKDGARGGVKVEGGDGDGVEVEVKQEGGVKEELTPTPGILETMREGEFEARAGV